MGLWKPDGNNEHKKKPTKKKEARSTEAYELNCMELQGAVQKGNQGPTENGREKEKEMEIKN